MSIKANLANMRAEAAIYYDINSSYGTTLAALNVTDKTACPGAPGTIMSDSQFCMGLVQAATASGNILVLNVVAGVNSSWVTGVTLKSIPSQWQCVDSAGNSKTETTSSPEMAIVAATKVCP